MNDKKENREIIGVRVKDYDELRQQMADVSHERDILRASRHVVAKKLAEAMSMVSGASDEWTAEVYEILLNAEVKS